MIACARAGCGNCGKEYPASEEDHDEPGICPACREAFAQHAEDVGTAHYDPLTDLDGQAHVLLDALTCWQTHLRTGVVKPWEDYDGIPEMGQMADPWTYRRLLCAAIANAIHTLDHSDPAAIYATELRKLAEEAPR